MGAAIFIGDELTAAGFRLTGMETITPSPKDAGTVLADARTRAALVIMTADIARHVPAAELEMAMLAETPTLTLVPDVRSRRDPPDIGRRLRRVLGIET